MIRATVSDDQKSNESYDELGAALFARFTKGVQEDGWKVIALGSASAMSLNSAMAKELGFSSLEKVVVLIAERP